MKCSTFERVALPRAEGACLAIIQLITFHDMLDGELTSQLTIREAQKQAEALFE